MLFEVLRFVLLAACVLAVVGPIVLPAATYECRSPAAAAHPAAPLYLAQCRRRSADPWMLLVAAVVVAMPVGLAAGGAPGAAVLAAAAGLLLMRRWSASRWS